MKRRDFIRTLPAAAGGFLLKGWPQYRPGRNPRRLALGPRLRRPNPWMTSDGRPRVVCIEGRSLPLMLRKGLAALGGLERLVPDGRGVLIKPNLVLREPAPLSQYPTMSHPGCIRELIHLVRTVSNDVAVGDQGGEDQALIYDALDLRNAVNGAGARLIDFERESSPTLSVRLPHWAPDVPDYEVFRSIHEAPVIISLCNLKRHSSAFMTGAIKNMFGALAGRWSSGTRGYVHRHANLSQAFLESLPDVAALINPELTIVDAREILIGNGPLQTASGAEVLTGVDRLVLSGDPVAVDAYCARRIMAPRDPSFDPESITPTLRGSEALGLGISDLGAVEILEIDETWIGGSKRSRPRR